MYVLLVENSFLTLCEFFNSFSLFGDSSLFYGRFGPSPCLVYNLDCFSLTFYL